MPLVGIPFEVLIELLLMAFFSPIVIVLVWWFVWVPRSARAISNAKLFRNDVFIEANDLANLQFHGGKIEGSGVFETKKGEKTLFVPRSEEPWVNKVFGCDKIRFIFGCSGKSAGVNAETLATLQANLMLHTEQLQSANPQLSDDEEAKKVALKKWLDNTPPEYKQQFAGLIETLAAPKANIPKEDENEDSPKKDRKREFKRKVAILFDPRILRLYISQAISPSQVEYVKKKAYNKGYNDGEKPFLYRALPLILIIGVIMLGLVAVLYG